ncbi:MAG: transglycosylase SLT domain-containing protein [Limnohabitans sp.]
MTVQLKIRSLQTRLNWGLLNITRHSLALFGTVCLAVLLVFASQPDWRLSASERLLGWLESRHDAVANTETTTADDPVVSALPIMPAGALSEEQAAVTRWLSRRYKVSPEPLGALVHEAWTVGDRIQVSPTLLLAVIAIESRFNPFASSPQGGMGLMQIEPVAQHRALLPYGGPLAAFDPLTNLRVGARHLQALIEQSASVEAALQLYALATGQSNGLDYVHRVLAEQKQLETMTQLPKSAQVTPNSRL